VWPVAVISPALSAGWAPHVARASQLPNLVPAGESHCFFRFVVQFTTKVRGVFCSLRVLITNFFPSGVTS